MNENIFKEAKEKYETIHAPKTLKKSVEKTFNKSERNVFPKVMLGTAMGIFLCFVTILNVNPVFATSISTNDFVRGIVNVLTANKYEVNDKNINANIVTAKITGIKDKKVEERINKEFEEMINSVIDDFEKSADDLRENYPEAHYGMDAGYIVKTDNDKYLSVDIYVVNTVGSSSTKHKFYNVDKITGNEIQLKDMIKSEDYIEKLTNDIVKEIERLNAEEGVDIYFATYDDVYKLLSNKEEFYINEAGNPVIVFDKYEIGIGAIGCPEFEIK